MRVTYLRNDVVASRDGTLHRILHIEVFDKAHGSPCALTGRAWLIHLTEPLALPFEVPLEQLHTEYKAHSPEPTVQQREASDLFQPKTKAFRRAPSAASIALSLKAYERISSLVDNPAILSPTTRHALLVERSKHAGGGTPKTLLKDLRNWWQGGQTQDALFGKYSLCGRHDVVGTGKRGRKRQAKGDLVGAGEAALQPYQLGQHDLDNMREVLEMYYFEKGKQRTLTATLQHLHETRYTFIDGNGDECLLPERECPSYRQLSRFLKTNYPLHVRLSRRKGEKRFAQEDRATEGSIQIECHGAGHIYEFDATIVDVKLVSTKDRSKIVGKPTLYLIIDRHSRLIVGYYIGFENACYTAAMQAILSIGEDKEALCERLGLPYDSADWPAHGVLPEMFLADQGELVSREARRIGMSLRSTISNVPGLRPDWKPLVECGFKMMQAIIAPDTPGYAPDAEARKRRSINVDKDVALNIFEFTAVIVAGIIAHNKTMQKGYPLTDAQVADRQRPIPRELFEHSVQRRMGSLDRMNFEKVREELLPRGEAVVTADGVSFKKMFFSCPEAREHGWLVQGRRQRMPIQVAFDYRLVDEIILYSPNGSGESFVAKLTKDSVKFEGMSFKEVAQHFHDVEELTADAIEVKRQAQYEFHKQTKPIIEVAVKEMKSITKGMSRSGRRRDIAPARAEELRGERTTLVDVFNTQAAVADGPRTAPQPSDTAKPMAKVISINQAHQAKSSNNEQAGTPTVAPFNNPHKPPLAARMAELRLRMQGSR